MPFHRFTQPSYSGIAPLPAGPATITFNGIQYNFINVVSGGVGASGSAYADNPKSEGVNTGTYFQAFNEDARSTFANRGLRALAENTDVLDDWFHRDLAAPIATALATAGAPVASVVLPAATFVGTSGTYPLASLFSVVDQNDNDVLNGTTKVAAASIAGAAVGSGFSSGLVTVTLTAAIPAGTQYRVYYATRSNLATLPTDALTSISVRSVEGVEGELQSVVRNIKGETFTGLDTPWDTAPVFSLAALGFGGLDGLYRRANIPPTLTAYTPNVPGAGGTITADGGAVTSFIPRGHNYTPSPSIRRQVDPFQALLRAEESGSTNSALPRNGLTTLIAAGDMFNTHSVGHLASYTIMRSAQYQSMNEGTSVLLEATTSNQLLKVTLDSGFFRTVDDTLVNWGFDVLRVMLPETIGGSTVLGTRDVGLLLVAPGVQDNEAYVTGLGEILPSQLSSLAAPVSAEHRGFYRADVVHRLANPGINPMSGVVDGPHFRVNDSTNFLSSTPKTAARAIGNNIMFEWSRYPNRSTDQDPTKQLRTVGQLRSDGIATIGMKLGRPYEPLGPSDDLQQLGTVLLEFDSSFRAGLATNTESARRARGILSTTAPIVGKDNQPFGIHGEASMAVGAIADGGLAVLTPAQMAAPLLRFTGSGPTTHVKISPLLWVTGSFTPSGTFTRTYHNGSTREVRFTDATGATTYASLFPGEIATFVIGDPTMGNFGFQKVSNARGYVLQMPPAAITGSTSVSAASAATNTNLATVAGVYVPPRGVLRIAGRTIRTGTEASVDPYLGIFLGATELDRVFMMPASLTSLEVDWENTTGSAQTVNITMGAWRSSVTFAAAHRKLTVTLFA